MASGNAAAVRVAAVAQSLRSKIVGWLRRLVEELIQWAVIPSERASARCSRHASCGSQANPPRRKMDCRRDRASFRKVRAQARLSATKLLQAIFAGRRPSAEVRRHLQAV